MTNFSRLVIYQHQFMMHVCVCECVCMRACVCVCACTCAGMHACVSACLHMRTRVNVMSVCICKLLSSSQIRTRRGTLNNLLLLSPNQFKLDWSKMAPKCSEKPKPRRRQHLCESEVFPAVSQRSSAQGYAATPLK